MAEITRRVVNEPMEEVVEVAPVENEVASFPMRMAQLGALIRERAKEVLKFDSNVDNINYDYVDTQQYKNLLGVCCDKVGVGFQLRTYNEHLSTQIDAKGTIIYIVDLSMELSFFDPFVSTEQAMTARFTSNAFGMGVSRGNSYAAGIAQTNAVRNLITNMFMIPTNDREGDDVREGIKPAAYLTDTEKAAKREELLDKTKSSSLFATVQYGNIVYARIQETLKKDIDPAFRETLERFVENKFINGKPIPQPEDDSLWIVKKSAANKILSDLDEV